MPPTARKPAPETTTQAQQDDVTAAIAAARAGAAPPVMEPAPAPAAPDIPEVIVAPTGDVASYIDDDGQPLDPSTLWTATDHASATVTAARNAYRRRRMTGSNRETVVLAIRAGGIYPRDAMRHIAGGSS